MERSAVELDFFNMEKESATTDAKLYPDPKLESGLITFRDIDSVISKSDFTGLASALAAGKGAGLLDPPTPRADYHLLPAFRPTSRLCCGLENGTKIAPLTIFYDGTIAVFDATSDKADDILKFAERSKIMDAFSSKKQLFVETLTGDLPLARRNSLLRFLEKRKERLTMGLPYGFPQSPIYGSLGHTASGNKN